MKCLNSRLWRVHGNWNRTIARGFLLGVVGIVMSAMTGCEGSPESLYSAQGSAPTGGAPVSPGASPPGSSRGGPASSGRWDFAASKFFIETEGTFNGDRLAIVSRASWGAAPVVGTPAAMRDVHGIVVHHTESNTTVPLIQKFHQKERGWSDIGYHYVIAPDDKAVWRVFEGRELKYQGAHTGNRVVSGVDYNLNVGQVGISMMGDYGPWSASNPGGYPSNAPEAQRQPPRAAQQLLGDLVARLRLEFPHIRKLFGHGLGPNGINPGHTDCPGEGQLHIVASLLDRFALSSSWDPADSTGTSNLALAAAQQDIASLVTADQAFRDYAQALASGSLNALKAVVTRRFIERTGGEAHWIAVLGSLANDAANGRGAPARFKLRAELSRVRAKGDGSFFVRGDGHWFLVVSEAGQFKLDSPIEDFDETGDSEV